MRQPDTGTQSQVYIRPARVAELPMLQEIEVAAGRVFRDIGMASVADDEPPTIEVLARYQAAATAW